MNEKYVTYYLREYYWTVPNKSGCKGYTIFSVAVISLDNSNHDCFRFPKKKSKNQWHSILLETESSDYKHPIEPIQLDISLEVSRNGKLI